MDSGLETFRVVVTGSSNWLNSASFALGKVQSVLNSVYCDIVDMDRQMVLVRTGGSPFDPERAAVMWADEMADMGFVVVEDDELEFGCDLYITFLRDPTPEELMAVHIAETMGYETMVIKED